MENIFLYNKLMGRARGSIVGWDTMLLSRKVAGSIPVEVIGIFGWPNPSSRTVALGLTQPLTEMSTRNLPGYKGRPARKADKFSAICELKALTSRNPLGLHGLVQG
jgi:hypothetical protein